MGIVIVICISLIFKVEFQYKLGIIYGLICALLGTIFQFLTENYMEKHHLKHYFL